MPRASKITPLSERTLAQLQKRVYNLTFAKKPVPTDLLAEIAARNKAQTDNSDNGVIPENFAKQNLSGTSEGKPPLHMEIPGSAASPQPRNDNEITVSLINTARYSGGIVVSKISADNKTLLEKHQVLEPVAVLLNGKVLDAVVHNMSGYNNPAKEHKIFFANGTQWTKFSGDNKFSGAAAYISEVRETEKGLHISLSNGQMKNLSREEIIANSGGKIFGKVSQR
jgi:hypothetical protein